MLHPGFALAPQILSEHQLITAAAAGILVFLFLSAVGTFVGIELAMLSQRNRGSLGIALLGATVGAFAGSFPAAVFIVTRWGASLPTVLLDGAVVWWLIVMSLVGKAGVEFTGMRASPGKLFGSMTGGLVGMIAWRLLVVSALLRQAEQWSSWMSYAPVPYRAGLTALTQLLAPPAVQLQEHASRGWFPFTYIFAVSWAATMGAGLITGFWIGLREILRYPLGANPRSHTRA